MSNLANAIAEQKKHKGEAAGGTVAPAPAPAAQEATVVVPAEAVVSGLSVVPANPGTMMLSELPHDEASAALTLTRLFTSTSLDMSEDASAINQGGNSFKMPFARLAKGKWEPFKDLPQEQYDFMPSGERPYNGIFLGYRVGGTAWRSSMTNNPPVYKCVAPNTIVGGPKARELFDKIMSIGSKIKYTKAKEKVKYDAVGRLIPELHVLVWTPKVGMITLVIPGHESVLSSIKALKDATKRPLFPYKFAVVVNAIVNKNAAEGADNRSWTEY